MEPSEKKPAPSPSHFRGKEAVEHVIEAQSQGLVSSVEAHGEEAPGHLSAAADAARDTALALTFLWMILERLHPSPSLFWISLLLFAFGWIVWKMGRSAWLGWTRLERLHRVMAEEQWEIEHHRQQEREELGALYQAKGFQGQLLEDVLDVLMADGDRLLKVMLEEELGLSLEKQEHPLKQSLGAGAGSLLAACCCFLALWLFPGWGILAAASCMLGISGALAASYEKNRLIPAILWNIGIGGLAFGSTYFLFDYFVSKG